MRSFSFMCQKWHMLPFLGLIFISVSRTFPNNAHDVVKKNFFPIKYYFYEFKFLEKMFKKGKHFYWTIHKTFQHSSKALHSLVQVSAADSG